jgi:hypothetical protein
MATLENSNLWDAAVKGGKAALQARKAFDMDMNVPFNINGEQQFNTASNQENTIRDLNIKIISNNNNSKR